MKNLVRSMVCGGCFLSLAACIPALHEEQVHSPPHPVADATPSRDRRHDLEFTSDTSDGALVVTATETPWCRDTSPMVQDTGTRRHLDGGALSYVVNGVGSLALGGIGIGLAAAPCNGCTPDQAKNVQLTGAVIAVLAVVPIGLIIWNAVRSADDVTSTPVQIDREWTSCGKAVAARRKTVRVTFSDGNTLEKITDSDGQATFDLSSVNLSDDALASGSVRINVTGSNKVQTGSLRGVSRYDTWIAARDAAERERLARQQAERQAQQQAATHDAALKALQDCEHALAESGPPWTDAKLIAFSNMLATYDHINVSTLTADEKKRYDKIASQRDARSASYEHARTAALAKAQQATLVIGRAIILSMLKAPSTASFVSDGVMFQCASGVVMTEHVVDAQNSFGAMVRERYCPKFDPVGRRVYFGPGSTAMNLDCIQSFGSMGGLPWTRDSFCKSPGPAAEDGNGGHTHNNPCGHGGGACSSAVDDWSAFSASF